MSYYYGPQLYNFDYFIDETFGRQGRNPRRLHINVEGGDHDSDCAVDQVMKPKMDLDNAKNVVIASFELPGTKKEDVQIDIRDGSLTVSGETKISESDCEHDYAIRERRFGKFSRTIELPHGVKEEEICAAMKAGVLTVTIPKAEGRKVAIS
ncbi:hypothetical protein V5O48_016124 [Marasmius crinis-equi]|uniref:SHSP domain-containing protein n=1 Tax=Marasmius crinis-equi TaxID=585013 RepID=A0ABR3ESJ2_9AGAR